MICSSNTFLVKLSPMNIDRNIPTSKNISHVKRVHLIAICGTGMGTLAGLLKAKGFEVSGSDLNVYPPMSTQLRNQHIELQEGFDANRLKNKDLIVVGNVISRGNVELEFALENKLPLMSLPEALKAFFLDEALPLTVTGTHGKTTTSAIATYLLDQCGKHPGFFVGGVLENYGKSFGIGIPGGPFVVEGDEYDSACFDKRPKFVHYTPKVGMITSIEFDHADIYRDLDHVVSVFKDFISAMAEDSVLIACGEDPIVQKIAPMCRGKVEFYGEGTTHTWGAVVEAENENGIDFSLFHQNNSLGKFHSPLPGRHNLKNLLGVLAAISHFGVKPQVALQKLEGFKSVLRRQQVRGVVGGVRVIDDFAHHPTAVRVTLEALRKKYPKGRLWAIFEPRTATSRRSVFQDEYVKSFDHADVVVIAKPFDQRKIPEGERFSASQLVEDMKRRRENVHYLAEIEEILDFVKGNVQKDDTLAVMSNGGFGGIQEKLLKSLEEKTS